MTEAFQQWDRLRESERRVAMATLVATRGTTPKKEGAKMWVSEDGRVLGSVTIGGCVDGLVIEAAADVLRSGRARLVPFDLGDQDAWDLGLTCAGTLDVLIEPVDLAAPADPCIAAYERVRAEVEAGGHGVVVTPLDDAARKLVILSDGGAAGSLGDPELDEEAGRRALELVRRGASRTVTLGSPGAERAAFFEVYGPPPTLVIFGAGHVAQPIARFARELGMRIIIVDARPRFANPESFPEADEIRVGIPSEIAGELRYDPGTSVVLVAHDYKYDIPVLQHVLKTDAAYIGMLGSRRRGATILNMLAEAGAQAEDLARVHVPIGLDIGAETAAEFAVSILGEALAVRSGRPGGPMRTRSAARPAQR